MRVFTAMGSCTCDAAPSPPCVGLGTTRVGEPDAGNLHVRFDEGERLHPRSLLDCCLRANGAESGTASDPLIEDFQLNFEL